MVSLGLTPRSFSKRNSEDDAVTLMAPIPRLDPEDPIAIVTVTCPLELACYRKYIAVTADLAGI